MSAIKTTTKIQRLLVAVFLFLMLASVLILAEAGSRTASASIATVTGNVQIQGGAPISGSLVEGSTESNEIIRAYQEAHGYTLADKLHVDITSPGTYSTFTAAALPGDDIPAGTEIDSHLLHFDKIGRSSTVIRASGSISFDEEIIGVIVLNNTAVVPNPIHLNNSDYLGMPDVVYPKDVIRDLEPPHDSITLSADRHTVSVRLGVTDGVDHVRVITAAQLPEAVDSVPPTADAGGPYSVNEGGSVQLDGTGSSDLDGSIVSFEWDLDNDGQYDDATGPTPTFDASTLDGPSTHTIGLRVTDDDGATHTDTATVTVHNVAPTITAAFQVAPIPEGSVSTSGNLVVQATDPAGPNDPLTFTFDCDNDGSYETPAIPSTSAADCFFDDNGSYTVGVQVSDDDGGVTTGSIVAVVTNVAPTAFLPGAGPVDEGSPATLTFENQFDPSTADSDAGFGYSVACDGDASALAGSYGAASPSHDCTYPDNGTYTVAGRILDKDGGFTDYTATVTVVNVAPTVTADGDEIDENETATVGGTISDPGALDSFTVVIDWGEGAPETYTYPAGATTFSETHHYVDDDPTGTPSDVYTVTVTVTDKDGGVGEVQATVTVNNVAPEVILDTSGAVTLGGDPFFLGEVGVAQDHSASATDQGADDLTFSWSFGASETYLNPGGVAPFAASDTASVTFTAAGVYTIAVTVTDDDTGTAADSLDAGDCTRTQGFWGQQFRPNGHKHVDAATLAAYLAMIDVASGVFEDTSPQDANAVFSGISASMRDKALAQLLAAWLNWASGGVGWTELVDTDTDGDADTPFHQVIAQAEAILLDANASHQELEQAKNLAEAVNLHAPCDGGEGRSAAASSPPAAAGGNGGGNAGGNGKGKK